MAKTSVFVHALKYVIDLERETYDQTLILSAAKKGHDAVVELLAATGQVDVRRLGADAAVGTRLW
jgi:hypothetical protein